MGYCRENGIEYIFDSTNNDTTYSRNFIRREILPRFERLNPSYLETIGRLGNLAREDAEFLMNAADNFLSENTKDGGIDVKTLTDTDSPVSSRALMRMYSKLSDRMLESVHIGSLLTLAGKAVEGSSISLPGEVTARISRGRLYFTKGITKSQADFYYELKPGLNRFESPDFAVLVVPSSSGAGDYVKDNESLKNIYKLSIHTKLKSDKINHILFVRQKNDGDAYVYGNMTRKLKKLFNDRGIDRERRLSVPVFCDADGIVWVPGFGVADRVKADLPYDKGNTVEIYYYYNL